MYPELEINLSGIVENAKKMQAMFDACGKKLCVVTKGMTRDIEIVHAITENGISAICESHIQNFVLYKDIRAEKWLIREPMLSEIPLVVQYTDVSMNSELKTLIALNEEAKRQNKIHKVVLMYELGDRREGCDLQELTALTKEVLGMENLYLYGIGTNLSCYGAIIPDEENMKELAETAEHIEKELGITLELVSGGNSTSFEMFKDGLLPEKINNLRFGEAVFFGNVPCLEKKIEGFHTKNFVLRAQIVEIKEKPSLPKGSRGEVNTFGEALPEYEDKGIRKRAILAVGKQDVAVSGLRPRDTHAEVVGGSSDYIILDITESPRPYQVGDVVEFDMNYSAVLETMCSNFIYKTYKKGM
ncbi:MAG: alanine/ornithine racemase family PLP-dependent enzyme [Clostridia bacterium]|nr:alanine/ornithine racemase family PLP-dependent enzyme [Clostridia bacterium]